MESTEGTPFDKPGADETAHGPELFSAPSDFFPALSQRLASRNVSVTNRSSLAELADVLESQEWSLRAAVFKAIGERGDTSLLPLARSGLVDEHPLVRAAAVRALGKLDGALPLMLVARSLEDESWQVREIALLTLGDVEAARRQTLPDAVGLMEHMLSDEDSTVRSTAAEVLHHSYPAAWQQLNSNHSVSTDAYREQMKKNLSPLQQAQNEKKAHDTGGTTMQNMPDLPRDREGLPEISESAGQMGSNPQQDQRRRISRRVLIAGVGVAALGTAASYFFLSERSLNQPGPTVASTKATSTPASTPTHRPAVTSTEPPPAPGAKHPGTIVTTYSRQGGTIADARWSPDGRFIASASSDKTVNLWSALDGSPLFVYTGHSDQVNSLDWSPDGKYIVSGGGDISLNSGAHDYSIHIWSASSYTLVRRLSGPNDYIHPIRWSPNGKYIAAACYNKNVYVWEAATGRLVTTYTGHGDSATCLAWSPDSQFLVTGVGYPDNTFHIWKAATGARVLIYPGLQSAGVLLATAWSPNGKWIASSAGGQNTNAIVTIWDPATGQTISTYRGHTTSVQGNSFTGTRRMAGFALGPVLPQRQLSGSGIGVFSVAWSPDSKHVASGGGLGDGTVQIWNPTSHQHLYTFPSTSSGSYVNSLEWSFNGTYLASTSASQTTVWGAQV
jgi:WD40 repeat protein